MGTPKAVRGAEPLWAYNVAMFELLEGRRKPNIKWWTMPSALFIVLCLGINIGILVGRRSWDILEWGQAAFMTIVAWLIVSPILREMIAKLKNDGDR